MRRDVTTELKELRLLGMVNAWTDLTAQGDSQVTASKWLIEHLLQAEHTDRAMRSISHQMKVARFPIHRDLAGFDFTLESAKDLDEGQIDKLATLEFVDTAQNVVFIGGPGTGKTQPCQSPASGLCAHPGAFDRADGADVAAHGLHPPAAGVCPLAG